MNVRMGRGPSLPRRGWLRCCPGWRPGRTGFLSKTSIDGVVVEVAKAAATGLEAETVPGWLWQSAIHQGFTAMHLLNQYGGGFLVADLETRELAYRKLLVV